MIAELLLDVDARPGSFREELNIFLTEHAGHPEVLDQDLHDLAGVLHHCWVCGTRVEHAASHTAGQGLRRHEVHVTVVDHGEPDSEQQGHQLLVAATQGGQESVQWRSNKM